MATDTARIYVDTSVFGGVFDDEFEAASREFFQQVADGRFRVVTSAAVDAEVQGAPEAVRRLYEAVLPLAEVLPVSPAARDLAEEYVRAGAVTARSREDALHVALAAIHGCDALVSWDFRHLCTLRAYPCLQRGERTARPSPDRDRVAVGGDPI
jgi:predicted nucleic acid-binding protein